MQEALLAQNRTILYSLCEWGMPLIIIFVGVEIC